MYTIDLNSFTLKQLKDILKRIKLIPSRRMLLTDVDKRFKTLQEQGIKTAADLQSLLKKKTDIPCVAAETGIPDDYLVLLKREVGSYIVKPLKLALLDIFSTEELAILEKLGIKNTKH